MAISCDGVQSWHGRVLSQFESNRYDDSDFFALVWNDDTQRVERILVGTTRWAMWGRAEIDATPNAVIDAKIDMIERLHPIARRELETVEVGSHVQSLTTKGQAHGVSGTVERIMLSRYQSIRQRKHDPQYVVRVRVDGPTTHARYEQCVFVSWNRVAVSESAVGADVDALASDHVYRYGIRGAWTTLEYGRM